MPLPASWVNSIFARLQVRYGAAWLNVWKGVDIDAVKADWAEELAGFVNAPDAIKHALAHLPIDRPPNVSQFVALARSAPEINLPALPAPPADPAVVAQVLRAVNRPSALPARDWAQRLRRRDQQGDRLTQFQRAAWREALNDLPAAEAAQ